MKIIVISQKIKIRVLLSSFIFLFALPFAFAQNMPEEATNITISLKRIEKQLLALTAQQQIKNNQTSAKTTPASKKLAFLKEDSSTSYILDNLETRLAALEAELRRIVDIVEKIERFKKNDLPALPKLSPILQKRELDSTSHAMPVKKNTPFEKKTPATPLKSKGERENIPRTSFAKKNTSSEKKSLAIPMKLAAQSVSKNIPSLQLKTGEEKATEAEKKLDFSPVDDVDAYNVIQKTIRENKLALASVQIKEFLKNFSNSSLKPNILYWAGEIARALKNNQEAASHFLNVYTQYPSHPKAPESLLKLALVLKDLNKIQEAKATLKRLETEYPYIANNLKSLAKNLHAEIEEI